MIYMIIIVFIIFIFLIPIPLKFTIHYSSNDYYLKFFNINIYSKDAGILRKLMIRNSKKGGKVKEKPTNFSVEEDNKKVHKKNTHKFSIKKLFYNIKKNKYKPRLLFNADIYYSFNDSYINAISYGILNNFNFILYQLLGIFFNLKKFNLNLEPNINSPFMLNFTAKSIFRFNLAQIIYMLFLILQSRIKLKEVDPI